MKSHIHLLTELLSNSSYGLHSYMFSLKHCQTFNGLRPDAQSQTTYSAPQRLSADLISV